MSLIPLGFWAASGGGGGAGAFDLLETTTLTSSASSVTFSGLDAYSDYKHLQIRAVGRTTQYGGLWIQINSDTGNNYARHRLNANGTNVTSSSATSQSYVNFDNVFVGALQDGNAQVYGAAVVDILDFSSSSKNTTLRALGGNRSTSYGMINFSSGLWNSTAAATSIKLYDDVANLVAGSRFSLYGVK